MPVPQFLSDLLQLLFDLAVPAAFCTLAAAGVGVPGLLCTSSDERDWTKRSGRWRRVRSIQLNRL